MRKGSFTKILMTFLTLFLFGQVASGQRLLNRVLNQSKRKIEQKATDLLVEKASEAIANKIYESMSDAFDKMMEDAIKQDSAYQANASDSVAIKYADLANSWMERMNQAADVPESYEFSHRIEVEIEDNKETSEMVMYLDSDDPIFGIEQEENDDVRLIVVDTKNDITVMYMDNKDGKKAQAIPNLMGIGATLARSQVDSIQKEFSLTKTGRSKSILGYHAEEYESEDDEFTNTIYITKELGVDWRSSFVGLLEKFGSVQYGDKMDDMEGFLLESKRQSKKKKSKDYSSWTTKKVEIKSIVIDNGEYEFGGLYDQ